MRSKRSSPAGVSDGTRNCISLVGGTDLMPVSPPTDPYGQQKLIPAGSGVPRGEAGSFGQPGRPLAASHLTYA